MKTKTTELTGDPLDWAVHHAYCEGACDNEPLTDDERYSTDWAQGGPIIEREEIDIYCYTSPKVAHDAGLWLAEITGTTIKARGKTPLIAAMRCYVTSKLGDEVDVPEELLK